MGRRRAGRHASFALAALLGLSGCSADGVAAPAGPVDPCEVLTEREVAATVGAVGQPVAKPPSVDGGVSFLTCVYPVAAGGAFTLAVRELPVDVAAYEVGFRTDRYAPVGGIGDSAYLVHDGEGGQALAVRVDRTALVLQVRRTRPVSDAALGELARAGVARVRDQG